MLIWVQMIPQRGVKPEIPLFVPLITSLEPTLLPGSVVSSGDGNVHIGSQERSQWIKFQVISSSSRGHDLCMECCDRVPGWWHRTLKLAGSDL
jgi:hypothetical protein